MRIPVILLNHNSAIDCRKCVSFLQRQKGVDIEIVVVDNCSSKNDLNELQTLCKEELCTLIENKENHGYNAGNNIGLRYVVKKRIQICTNSQSRYGISGTRLHCTCHFKNGGR